MADSNIKQILIKGGAINDYTKERRGRTRKVVSQKRQQDGGFDSPPGNPVSTSMNFKAAQPIMNAVGKTFPSSFGSAIAVKGGSIITPSLPEQKPQPPVVKETIPFTQSLPLPLPLPLPQNGGLTLVPPKKEKKSSRLILAPPSYKKKQYARNGSWRGTRKIKVHLETLKKKMTRAKSIHKDSREKSIDEIRKILEEAKLIKPLTSDKKVPESILREIYRDYILLRSKAL